MMGRDYLEIELKKASLSEVEMQQNRIAVRGVLDRFVQSEKKRTVRCLHYLFPIGLAAGFALGVIFMHISSAPQKRPDVADDLSSVWCTYINTTDEDDIIWPPRSTHERNNFVKSAPGYGNEGYAVRFKGSVGHADKRGFMGVAATLGAPCFGANCSSGVDIKNYKKIRFKMKGRLKGGELVLRISSEHETPAKSALDHIGTIAAAYEATITDLVAEDWQTVTLDLRNDFKPAPQPIDNSPPDIEDILADARQLKWHVRNGKRAVADVWIDELEFF